MDGEERDVTAELEEHAHDADEWEDEPAPIEVRPAKTTVISCRLPVEEFEALELAARSTGESISEFVRRAVELRRTRRGAPSYTLHIVSGWNYTQIGDEPISRGSEPETLKLRDTTIDLSLLQAGA